MSDNLVVTRERSVEEYLRELPSLVFPACVNRSKYVVVPGKQRLIAREQNFNGLQFHPAREQCAYQGLQMSRIDVFLAHYCTVRDAALGRTELYDGNRRAWQQPEAEQLWERISTHCWTWLDAVFYAGADGGWEIETDLKIKRFEQEGGSAEQRSSRRTLLELPVREQRHVSLLFNAQGMPLQRAEHQQYVRGENMRFFPPVAGNVARFVADSDRADLNCGGPAVVFASLGVFASAEGTSMSEKMPRRFTEYDILIGEATDELYVPETRLVASLFELEQAGRLTPEMRELILRRAREKQ